MPKKIPIEEHLQIVEAQAVALSELRETASIEQANLNERLADLELALEDVGWQRMAMFGEAEFSRAGLKMIHALARLSYIKNPLIRRGVTVQVHYVFGQGVSISGGTDELDAVIQRFLKDPKNQVELTSHQARESKEVDMQVASNIFFCFFTTPSNGRVRVRTVPFDEIADIITNPEDRKEPRYYKREWSQSEVNQVSGVLEAKTRTAYYPDWRYVPEANEKWDVIGDAPVIWEAPIYHVKTGGMSDMQFGIPEVYPGLDWARAYKEFLENWSTIVKAYAKFAWSMTTKGGSAKVTAAKTKLASALGTGSAETNPAPVTGSTLITTEGVSMSPMRTAGATTAAEDGRRLLLMVAAVMGLPETFFGDTSVGTLATAKSLDRPTELKMVSRQTFWADIFRDILEYVVYQAIEAKELDGNIDDTDGVRVIRIADKEGQEATLDSLINISFPPILEHDIEASIRSIISGATLDGKALAGTMDMDYVTRMVLAALGVEDVEGAIARMNADKPSPEAKAMAEAIAEFTEAIREIRESD